MDFTDNILINLVDPTFIEFKKLVSDIDDLSTINEIVKLIEYVVEQIGKMLKCICYPYVDVINNSYIYRSNDEIKVNRDDIKFMLEQLNERIHNDLVRLSGQIDNHKREQFDDYLYNVHQWLINHINLHFIDILKQSRGYIDKVYDWLCIFIYEKFNVIVLSDESYMLEHY